MTEIELKIEQEVLSIMDEAKMIGGSSKEYGIAADNAIKLADLQKKWNDIDFDRTHRQDREDREWFKAQTERLDAEARMADANAKIVAAKYDCAGRVTAGALGLVTTMVLVGAVIGAESGDIIFPAKLLSIISGVKKV